MKILYRDGEKCDKRFPFTPSNRMVEVLPGEVWHIFSSWAEYESYLRDAEEQRLLVKEETSDA
jgi:hypothetical protein